MVCPLTKFGRSQVGFVCCHVLVSVRLLDLEYPVYPSCRARKMRSPSLWSNLDHSSRPLRSWSSWVLVSCPDPIGTPPDFGSAANPSLPYSLLAQPNALFGGQPGIGGGGVTNIPLFTPPMIFLVIVAYIGYHVLARQEATRARNKALQKASSSSSSSSSSKAKPSSSSSSQKPMSSADVRSKGVPSSSSKTGDPAPKHVSGGSGIDPRKDPSSNSYKKNYFLTMQGPGRPAFVPFQDGLRPKAGEAEGTLWWDNVPEGVRGVRRY